MANTPYNLEHRYNIQWMIDTYGLENLVIDDLIFWFVSLKAVSLYYMENGDPGQSELYRDYLTKLINLYNKNENMFLHGTPTISNAVALGGLDVS